MQVALCYNLVMGQGMHSFSVGSQFEAQIARDYLADNGIMCVVRCDEIPLKPGFSFGLEGWGSLLVTGGDADRARELLALIPGVEQEEEDKTGDTQSVSGAFQLQLRSIVGLAIFCLGWFLAWEVMWFLPGSPDWIWAVGVFPLALTGMHLTFLVILLTSGGMVIRELVRASPALLAAFVMVLFSPIWLIFQAFRWLRKRFEWLARLPEHLSD